MWLRRCYSERRSSYPSFVVVLAAASWARSASGGRGRVGDIAGEATRDHLLEAGEILALFLLAACAAFTGLAVVAVSGCGQAATSSSTGATISKDKAIAIAKDLVDALARETTTTASAGVSTTTPVPSS